MGMYLTVESLINEMVFELVKNQTIMKYLVYDDITTDPAIKQNVEDTNSFIYRPTEAEKKDFRLYALPKVPTITEEKKSMILCWASPQEGDGDLIKDYYVYFDIVSHIDIWTISGGIIRPLRIMDEINNVFAFKETENSIGKLYPVESEYRVYDTRGLFCGYRMTFKGSDFTKSLCRSE